MPLIRLFFKSPLLAIFGVIVFFGFNMFSKGMEYGFEYSIRLFATIFIARGVTDLFFWAVDDKFKPYISWFFLQFICISIFITQIYPSFQTENKQTAYIIMFVLLVAIFTIGEFMKTYIYGKNKA